MSKRWLVVSAFAASWLIVGVIDAVTGTANDATPPTTIPHGLVIMFLSFAWAKFDVLENGFSMPRGSAFFCGILPFVGVPIHLFRTRSVRRAMIATLKGAILLFGSAAGYFVVVGVMDPGAA